MRRLIPSIVALALVCAAQPQPGARAQEQLNVNIVAVDTSAFPEIAVDLQVQGANGRRVLALDDRNVHVLEDDATLPVTQLTAELAEADAPSRQVPLVAPDPQGKTTLELYATGAAIGVVFDNTSFMNAPKPGSRDHLAEARQAVEHFLLQPARAPRNPELVSLFVPIASPEESMRPAELDAWTADRNAIINYLRASEPRVGRTNLYATIQAAVNETAAQAARQGRDALVLVVADGSDEISGDSWAGIVSQAQARSVRIVAFGFGTDDALIKQRGGFQLNRLASATGGLYLQRPDDAAAAAAYTSHVPVVADSVFSLRFRSALVDDGQVHSFVVRVAGPDGTAHSQPVEFYPTAGEAEPLRPLGQVLLREYLPASLPLALIVSLLLVVTIGGLRWGHSRALSYAQTRR